MSERERKIELVGEEEEKEDRESERDSGDLGEGGNEGFPFGGGPFGGGQQEQGGGQGSQQSFNPFQGMQGPFGFPPMPPMPQGMGGGSEGMPDVSDLLETLITGGDEVVKASLALNRVASSRVGKLSALKVSLDSMASIIPMLDGEAKEKVKEAAKAVMEELREELERIGQSEVARMLDKVYYELEK